MMIMLTVATLLRSSRFIPSLKKVVEGRICTMYSFSASVAGRKSSKSSWRLRGFFFISRFLLYSRLILGSTSLYMISLTRFMMTMRVASTMVVPIIRG